MSTECRFAFLNTVIKTLCLIYSLNVPYGNRNSTFFCWKHSINLFKIDISATFHHTLVSMFFCSDISFRVILPLSRETIVMVLIADTKYIVCLLFPGSQPKFDWVSKDFLLLWESQREMHALAQWNMIGHRLFDSEPIGNIFYLHAAIFEIPM